ncbi:holo-ACP synthase [Halorubrum halodurans]|uniref:4'-phosphopantetheinyl transferase domain-containing protein n=1 Tax=Halorubrum halodurans TaxID=1383851 RepID=A0A256IGX6_9EURY|nr:4'-phosphopantetheinyl transferase superfamily protein [Halorubrum halodurans]OYR55794.1 hypothetical protein DJ70_10750 [Halorubrum halodurans]
MAPVPNCGIDIVAISRIERLLKEFPEQFQAYAFTEGERSYCDEQPYPEQHYAARWAVKEAYLKASPSSEINRDLSKVEIIREERPYLRIKDTAYSEGLYRDPDSEYSTVPAAISMAHERQLDLAIGLVCLPASTHD